MEHSALSFLAQITSSPILISDKRSGLFDGKTGDLIGQFTDGGEFAHGGGVMAVSYHAILTSTKYS